MHIIGITQEISQLPNRITPLLQAVIEGKLLRQAIDLGMDLPGMYLIGGIGSVVFGMVLMIA